MEAIKRGCVNGEVENENRTSINEALRGRRKARTIQPRPTQPRRASFFDGAITMWLISERHKKAIERVAGVYESSFPGFFLSDDFKINSIGYFLDSISVKFAISAMKSGIEIGKQPHLALRLFCGDCWIRIHSHKYKDGTK